MKRPMVAGAFCLLTGTAAIAADVPKFSSMGQALAEFTTNNVAYRLPAFDYVREALAAERDPVRLRTGFSALRTMAEKLGNNDAYAAVCRKAMASDQETRRFAGAVALANTAKGKDAARLAFDELKPFVDREEALSSLHRLSVVKTMSDMLAAQMADVDAACAFLDENANLSGTNIAFRCGCLAKQMTLLGSARRNDDALRKADELLSLRDCPSDDFFAASCLRSDASVQAGDIPSAERYLWEALSRDRLVPTGFARQMSKIGASPVACEKAVSHVRAMIASVPLGDVVTFRAMVERAQPEVVELLCRLGRFDEALGECRVMLFFAASKTYAPAVRTTADVMRKADGNLGRALAFLNFQKRNSVPAVPNVLLAVPQLDDDARRKGREELARRLDEGWSSDLSIAWRLLWLDSPKDSMAVAERAFSKAPLNSMSLQNCANAIMRPVAVAVRDPVVLKRITDYLLYGAPGPDGQAGTADDLGNPLAEMKARLDLPKRE